MTHYLAFVVHDQSIFGFKLRHQFKSFCYAIGKRFVTSDITHLTTITEKLDAVAHTEMLWAALGPKQRQDRAGRAKERAIEAIHTEGLHAGRLHDRNRVTPH